MEADRVAFFHSKAGMNESASLTSELKRLATATDSLLSRASVADYEEFVALIDLREETLQRLYDGAEASVEDRAIIRGLQAHDQLLLHHMSRLKTEAAETLLRIQQSRQGRNAYEGYGAQSFFIDKRN
ncbi:hypothetical protein HGI30_21085 [Paenibacillus albicereus]|uniref:Flagellar protein FliT n=1 Tax=Paenibacillus albicereus TaxID=2726185 RepID=A0A6H2H268_9BACL|nr:hypothetical protein [Paenibacillus albicereus]QJC53770.1 hypothetical protein HGI30_21085 [Paenibacillus albicereus]